MVQRPRGKIIRFGCRDTADLSFPQWRLWVQGNETYLAGRTWTGVSKASLHSSGNWGFTVGHTRVPVQGPRVINRNLSLGPRVCFAGVAPPKPLRLAEDHSSSETFLFDSLAPGLWRDFALLFSGSAKADELLKHMPPGTRLVGPMLHRNGNQVWLATFTIPMTAADIERIRSEAAKVRIHIKGEFDPRHFRIPSMLLLETSNDGDTMFTNICLGWENFVPDTTSS